MEIGYKQNVKDEITDERMKRLEQMVQVINEGWTKEEIQQETGLSRRTIEKDILLMKRLGLIQED